MEMKIHYKMLLQFDINFLIQFEYYWLSIGNYSRISEFGSKLLRVMGF